MEDTNMTIRKNLLRLPAAAILVAGLLAPVAALAAADLAITMPTPPTSIAYGATTAYSVKITNNGPDAAADATVTATVPAGAKVTAVSGCTKASSTVFFPCAVASLASGASATVKVSVEYAMPDPLPTTCPAASAFGAVSISVAGGSDASTADNTVTAQPGLLPLADVAIEMTGPQPAHDGGTYTYSITVTNNGPCAAAPDFAVDDSVLTGAFTFVSGTGACAELTGDFTEDGSDYQYCTTGTLAKGASATATKVYKFAKLSSDLTSSNQANGVYLTNVDGTYTDPDDTNDVADLSWVITKSMGCSSIGGGGPLALLGLGLALLLRRRRVA
jgi:uncharacterized protein (TIGR03382 family)/uncharacterized repeat protein (TIGR01451 family)